MSVPLRIGALTLAALCAFAANSVLCRLALTRTAIDPATFTTIRLVSGALMLWLIAQLVQARSVVATNDVRARLGGDWPSAAALLAYAVAFSFAYRGLTAATGALLLFGAVQLSMIAWSVRRGEHLRALQTLGIAIAFGGLVYLLLPGLSAPPLHSAVLMILAGVAWGVYSLRGRGSRNPLAETAGNFVRTLPGALLVSLFAFSIAELDAAGVGYAVLSGTIASGLGYAIWYTALPGMRTATAATAQLSVPVLATIGGIAFLSEPVTARLAIAGAAILGGIALVLRK